MDKGQMEIMKKYLDEKDSNLLDAKIDENITKGLHQFHPSVKGVYQNIPLYPKGEEGEDSSIWPPLESEECLSIEENLKKCYAYILGLLEYRDSVVNRMKDNPEWKLRFPIGYFGSKSNIVRWLDEDDLNLDILLKENYTQVSVMGLPNEIVIEMDILNQNKRLAYYRTLKETLEYLGIDKYLVIYTGGKSYHFHIFTRPDNLSLNDLDIIREKFVDSLKPVFPIDVQVTKPNTPSRIPFTFHPETRKEVRIFYPNIHNRPIEFFIMEFPKLLQSLEVWVPLFDKWIKESKKKEEKEIITSFSLIGKSRLLAFYKAILEEKWEDGRKRLLCLLFCLAKKLKIPKKEFEKQIKEWITRQYGKADSKAIGVLRSYTRHWEKYNWSWKGFLRRNLLEASDFEDREKLKEILDKTGISFKSSLFHIQFNSIVPPDISKATKWMWRDAKREEILRIKNKENKIIFWVKGVHQTVHLVTYQDGKWICDCRGFKKNGICSHILCSYNHIRASL